MKKLLILVALALLAGGYIGYNSYKEKKINVVETQTGRYMDVETYVRTNISNLSSVKEQLGGKFYVTSIETHGGAGAVSYEDGHNAYTADFTYHVTEEGKPVVDSFQVR
ncbi:hypothetical protein K2Q08_02635 [Patescibacteria group bacterium]|nr:hypothetical protein [Patescibacteria group bacterium]